MTGIFLHEWGNAAHVADAFDDPRPHEVNILLASYDIDGYEGDAFVLYEENGCLYEVSGSHCSCYGLEEQWLPEETDVTSLLMRVEKGRLGKGSNRFVDELRDVLKEFDKPSDIKDWL